MILEEIKQDGNMKGIDELTVKGDIKNPFCCEWV